MAGQGEDLKQGVYRTPRNFMDVIRAEFGPLTWDLAASADNAQAPQYLTETEDSLSLDRPWRRLGGWLWLNPPYGNIGEWAAKAAEEARHGAQILFLVPAAVGSNWYADSLHEKAEIRFLRPRLVFEFLYPLDYMDKKTERVNAKRAAEGLDLIPCAKAGTPNKDPYPKDLLLAVFDGYARDLGGVTYTEPPATPWNWKAGPLRYAPWP
jgi:phage N-6-adenine-methyltransferase